jgi:hypothetical protein
MSYHSSRQQSVPCFVALYRGDRLVALYDQCHSMSLGRQIASYLRRHRLVAEDIEVRVERRSDGL